MAPLTPASSTVSRFAADSTDSSSSQPPCKAARRLVSRALLRTAAAWRAGTCSAGPVAQGPSTAQAWRPGRVRAHLWEHPALAAPAGDQQHLHVAGAARGALVADWYAPASNRVAHERALNARARLRGDRRGGEQSSSSLSHRIGASEQPPRGRSCQAAHKAHAARCKRAATTALCSIYRSALTQPPGARHPPCNAACRGPGAS
jgi:hypothetical protein